jgi:hypothetical protein
LKQRHKLNFLAAVQEKNCRPAWCNGFVVSWGGTDGGSGIGTRLILKSLQKGAAEAKNFFYAPGGRRLNAAARARSISHCRF